MHVWQCLNIRKICLVTLVVLIGFVTAHTQNGNGQNNQNSGGSADRSLKSMARVNPSTLAMEFSLPLGSYPGRAGNAVPISFSYSSKLWEIKSFGTWSYQQSPISSNRIYVTDTRPKFAERSSAGWTSSLMPPRLEIKEEFFSEDGEAWNFVDAVLFSRAEYQSAGGPDNMLPNGCYETGRTTVCVTYGEQQSCTTTIYAYCHHGTGYTSFDLPDPSPGPTGGGITENGRTIKYVKRVRVYMPDGSSQEFRKDDAVHDYCNTSPNSGGCNGSPTDYDLTGDFWAVDGSKMRLNIGQAGQSSTLYLPNGSRYIFDDAGNSGDDWYATRFIDVSGNQTQFGQEVLTSGRIQGKVIDTLGRPEVADPLAQNKDVNLEVGNQAVSLPGLNGQSINYILKWSKLEDSREDPSTQPISYTGSDVCFIGGQNTNATHNDQLDNPNIPDDDDGPILFSKAESRTRICSSFGGGAYRKFNPVILSEVALPNGTKYEFKYNQFGEITKLIHPTGGYEKFEYGQIIRMGERPSPTFDKANRGVKKHWIYNSDGTLEQLWQYDASVNNNQYPVPATAPYEITITAPDGSQTKRFLHRTGGSNFGFVDPAAGRAYEEYIYGKPNAQGERRLYSRKNTEWTSLPPRNNGIGKRDPYIKSETQYIIEEGDNALKKTTAYEYDDELNVKKIIEYPYEVVSGSTVMFRPLNPPYPCPDDCGPTATPTPAPTPNPTPAVSPIRTTEMSYLPTTNPAPTADGVYLLGLPTLKVIRDGQNNIVAKSEMFYDENNHLVSSGAVGAGWVQPTWTKRGQLTSSRSYSDIATNQFVETHTLYDQYGNVRKTRDPKNNESEIQYDATFYAYPTKVITPAPDPYNSDFGTTQTSQVETTYDLATGLPLSVTNDFGQITKTEYDVYLRPWRVYPDNYVAPETQTIYGVPDANGQLSASQRFVKVRKQIDQTNWEEATTWFDGLGRTIKTQTKDSQGDVFSETKYDGMGRVSMTTNPYRAGETVLWNLTSTLR